MADDPEHQYLERTVAEPLVQAIADVCQKRPTDPIQYIAGYLYKYQQECQNVPSTGVQV
jgi:hypothetical protein